MINFVNYVEFIFKKSEGGKNYIKITVDANICYNCRKNRNFGIIKADTSSAVVIS
jgi:hypothetical protein